MIITAKGISKSYKRGKGGKGFVQVLSDTDLSIEGGKVYVIYGRSGSGKSTLMNILAGILSPSSGSVSYDGRDIYSLSDRELSALRCLSVGYIPQMHSAVGTLTVRENILLPSAISEKPVDSARADELIDLLGLTELADVRANVLSGGELRRLSLARALVNSPSVIFADEPTNDLDDECAKLVVQTLHASAQAGAAVVIVTHELFARSDADVVLCMQNSSLVREKG